jgi:hypothetical protein
LTARDARFPRIYLQGIIARFVRTPDAVLDELARKEAAAERPEPQHKHVAAEMTKVRNAGF